MVKILWKCIDEGQIGDPNADNPKAAWCCRIQDEEGLQAIREHLGEGFEDITAASFETETGDYENIAVTWGQPSYYIDNRYYLVDCEVLPNDPV